MLLPSEPVDHFPEWPPGVPSIICPLALVSPARTVGVQSRLYRRSCIDEKNKWSHLHKCLRASPYLRSLVRKLEFVRFVSFGKRDRFRDLSLRI
jgi:hypothetical protein